MALSKPWEILTNRILTALERGVAPWRRPWGAPPQAFAAPANVLTHKPYRGINTLLLDLSQRFAGYPLPFWLTFKQAHALGGHVLAGEKSTPIAFWKILRRADEESVDEPVDGDTTGAARSIPMMRLYNVFNVAQCSLPEAVVPNLPPAPEFLYSTAADVVARMPAPPRIDHIAGDRACYLPSLDRIEMPMRSQFHSEGRYWATLFHELAHSTGHASRLDRTFGAFGDEAYSREELTAEISAAMLCQTAGIALPELEQQSAAYIANWLTALQSDSRLVIVAAQAAQRAVDHILNTPAYSDSAAIAA